MMAFTRSLMVDNAASFLAGCFGVFPMLKWPVLQRCRAVEQEADTGCGEMVSRGWG